MAFLWGKLDWSRILIGQFTIAPLLAVFPLRKASHLILRFKDHFLHFHLIKQVIALDCFG